MRSDADATSTPHSVSRRAVLTAAAAGAGGLALAACSSGGSSSASSASSGGGGSANSAVASSTGSAAGQTLAKLDDIPIGQAVAATLAGAHVIVARPSATTAACFSAICTHEGCTVAPAGTQLHCPCHGSVYNAVTGAVIKGPAPKALPSVPVHVAGGEVVSGA